jgi:hypothetical protein
VNSDPEHGCDIVRRNVIHIVSVFIKIKIFAKILNGKVAILELVAACVEHQPGLTQLLLDINPGVSLVVEPAPVLPAQLAGKRS